MTIFLTGASGFIGRALVAELEEHGMSFRRLERGGEEKAATLAALAMQMRGSEAVVHLGLAPGATAAELVEANQALTSTLLKAAIAAGVRRFVHISSISVYGEPPPDGAIDERSPRLASLQAYAAMKQGCERIVLQAADRLEVVVLQPAIVYGPGGGWWTDGLLEVMRHQVWPLVDRGRGLCHPVHVSDVARAIRLALSSTSAPGQCLLITGPAVSWRQFLGHYGQLLGRPSTLAVPRSLLVAPQRWPSPLRRLIHRLIRFRYGRPLASLTPEQVSAFAARPRFDGRLAETVLGFRPRVSLESGMAALVP